MQEADGQEMVSEDGNGMERRHAKEIQEVDQAEIATWVITCIKIAVLLFFAEMRAFTLHGFPDQQGREIKEERAQSERGDIDNGVHGPAEMCDDVAADDEGAGFGTDVEHIDVVARAAVTEEIDAESDGAEGKIYSCGGKKLSEVCSGPSGKEKIKPQKYQNKVPGKRVYRKGPIRETHAFRGEVRDKSAHETERRSKGIQCLPEISVFEKGQQQAEIHGYTA